MPTGTEHFTVTVADRPDHRWPEFTRSAWEAVGSVRMYSFPMTDPTSTLGPLSVNLPPGSRAGRICPHGRLPC